MKLLDGNLVLEFIQSASVKASTQTFVVFSFARVVLLGLCLVCSFTVIACQVKFEQGS